MNFVKKLGKEIKWHGRDKNEPAHYCVNCELEVFDLLFVREADKKHHVHCLNCARKINDSLNNFVILEEYVKSDLLEIYDKFQLHVPTITQSTSSLATPTNSATNSTIAN